MNEIEIKNIKKTFDEEIKIFDDFSCDIESAKITTFLGPSGCGKSTLLNVISGLQKPDFGGIKINPLARIGYMLQDNILLPWRTLEENLLLGCEIFNISKDFANPCIDNYIKLFELNGFRKFYPETLSGGMKQRSILIRTLLINPSLLLLDEPFSSLDFDIKLKVQEIFIEYFYKHKSTIVLVTHDIEDAIALSDQIYILSEKPSIIKKAIKIDLGVIQKNPVEARLSPKFNSYFKEIWEELKYLG